MALRIHSLTKILNFVTTLTKILNFVTILKQKHLGLLIGLTVFQFYELHTNSEPFWDLKKKKKTDTNFAKEGETKKVCIYFLDSFEIRLYHTHHPNNVLLITSLNSVVLLRRNRKKNMEQTYTESPQL